jgi:hypothetical protein
MNSNVLGSAPLVGGTATITTSVPYIGTYAMTAQYLADPGNIGSTSGAITEVITGNTTLQIVGNTSTLGHQTNLTVSLQ